MGKSAIKSWMIAIFSITFLWSLCNLGFAIASKTFETNSIIYNCFIFLGASLSLLLYAGKGDLGEETIRSIDTWAYGILLILTYIIIYGLVSHTTATTGAFIQCFGIVPCSIASLIFLSRKINSLQWLGMILVSYGIYRLCVNVAPEYQGIVIVLTILFAVLQSARSITAEYHKTHSYAMESDNEKDKIRVVGYIMFVVAMLFLSTSFLFSFIQHKTGTEIISLIPDINEFSNPANIFIGLIVGACIMGPIRAIEFYSTNKLKSESYLALGTIAPFSTLFWEWATAPITGLSLKQFSQNDFIAGVIILSGGLIIAFSKAKRQIENNVDEYVSTSIDRQAIEDTADLISKTISHFNKDIQQVSKELQIPETAIKEILTNENVSLKKDVLKRAERLYRTNIATKDALTGLLNRVGLMNELSTLIKKNKEFVIFYIDLNKFKPINDNFGHQAGDEALKTIGFRLANFDKKCKIVSRLGGDEFVVVLEKSAKDNADNFKEKLQKRIEKFFNIESVDTVVGVSASIGMVCSAEHKSLKAAKLLDIADKEMLQFKKRDSDR